MTLEKTAVNQLSQTANGNLDLVELPSLKRNIKYKHAESIEGIIMIIDKIIAVSSMCQTLRETKN